MIWTLMVGCLINTSLYEERRAALSDQDGDGWSPEGGDCDDSDASRFPGAEEWCNGADDDCDDEVDDAAVDGLAWYLDADDDGFGAADADVIVACASPDGHVESDDDCDDGNSEVYPGALETWYDGVDQDCDQWSDFDADGDGHDSDRHGGSDCDDTDGTVHPAAVEGWSDLGEDNDCDGQLDQQVSLDLTSVRSIDGPDTDAGFGSTMTVLPAGWAGEDPVVLVGAGAFDGYSGMVAAWGQAGLSAATSTADADWVLTGEGFFGFGLAWAGSISEPVILVSAVTAESNRGVVHGWVGASIGQDIDESSFRVVGDAPDIFVGAAPLSGVDLDGDGLADLVTSAILDGRAASNGGSVAIFHEVAGLAGEVDYTDADVLLLGGLAGGKMSAGAVGDLSGGGREGLGLSFTGSAWPDPEGALIDEIPDPGVHLIDDVVSATLYACRPARSTDLDGDGVSELVALGGDVYQFALPLAGTVLPWEQALATSGFTSPSENFVTGFEDQVPYWSGRRALVASSVYDSSRGALAIETLGLGSESTYDTESMLFLGGERAGDGFATSFVLLDWDLDGTDDLLVGAPGVDGAATGAGRVYLIPAPR